MPYEPTLRPVRKRSPFPAHSSGLRLTITALLLAAVCAVPSWARGTKGGRGAVPGEAAPDFQLQMLDSEETVRLSTHQGDRPVVLIFGSYSCPPFRSQIPQLEELYQTHSEQAAFYLVYISEAHPEDAGHAIEPENEAEGISMKSHESLDDRLEAAATCREGAELTMPVIVDRMDGYAEKMYAAWPARFYIVGKDGHVAWQGNPGPPGAKADELAHALRKVLAGEPIETGEAQGSKRPRPPRPKEKQHRLQPKGAPGGPS